MIQNAQGSGTRVERIQCTVAETHLPRASREECHVRSQKRHPVAHIASTTSPTSRAPLSDHKHVCQWRNMPRHRTRDRVPRLKKGGDQIIVESERVLAWQLKRRTVPIEARSYDATGCVVERKRRKCKTRRKRPAPIHQIHTPPIREYTCTDLIAEHRPGMATFDFSEYNRSTLKRLDRLHTNHNGSLEDTIKIPPPVINAIWRKYAPCFNLLTAPVLHPTQNESEFASIIIDRSYQFRYQIASVHNRAKP
jgi:hypothetical protein